VDAVAQQPREELRLGVQVRPFHGAELEVAGFARQIIYWVCTLLNQPQPVVVWGGRRLPRYTEGIGGALCE
jgi:hypothetical protein